MPNSGEEFAGTDSARAPTRTGIAVGSAVKTASLMNVDNRIDDRMGVAARRLGLLDAEVVMGIPLSSTSKNIYFDRTKGEAPPRLRLHPRGFTSPRRWSHRCGRRPPGSTSYAWMGSP